MIDFKGIIVGYLSKIVFNVDRMADDAFFDSQEEFVEANKMQLDQGKDSVGDEIGTYKSYGGVSYKGTPLRPVNLNLTGSWRLAIETEPIPLGIELYNRHELTGELEYLYGEEIVGVDLNAKTADGVFQQMQNNAVKSIRQQIDEKTA